MVAREGTPAADARQYASTLAAIERLAADHAQDGAYRHRRDTQVHPLVVAGIEGFLEDLRAQAAEYEARHAARNGSNDD